MNRSIVMRKHLCNSPKFAEMRHPDTSPMFFPLSRDCIKIKVKIDVKSLILLNQSKFLLRRSVISSRWTYWLEDSSVHMSLISKVSPFRAVAKRNITMVMNPEASHSHQNETQQYLQEDLIQPEHESMSIKQFIQAKERPRTIPKFSSTPIHKAQLSEQQITLGSNIRKHMLHKNYNDLVNITAELNSRSHAHILSLGLTRSEITHFFKLLVHGQEERILEYNRVRRTLVKSELIDHIYELKNATYNITNLYQGLIATGFQFTSYEYALFLRLEVNNFRNDRASTLLNQVNTISPDLTKNIQYWNAKLEILGDANPGQWVSPVNHTKTLSSRAVAGGNVSTIEFGKLLSDFSYQLGDIIPNYKTHNIIILGAGRANSMELVEHQIRDVWGIPAPSDDPKESSNLKLLSVDSPYYPDHQLLENIVTAYGINGRLLECVHYIHEFQTAYKIDLKHANYFWRNLMHWTNMTVTPKDGSDMEVVESIWKLFQNSGSGFNPTTYHLRKEMLEKQGKLDELVDLLRETRQHTKRLFSSVEINKDKKLLTNTFKSCCSVAFKQNKEESLDLLKLMNYISLDSAHRERLEAVYNTELQDSMVERSRFNALQNEYDEQDDEDSLW